MGAALAVSGAIMQGMTRNPLADPGLLGLTAGANAGLAITLAFIPNANNLGIMIACFIGSAVGATMVFGIGMMKREDFHLCGSFWLVLQSLHSYLPFRKGRHIFQGIKRCIDVDSWREYRNFMEQLRVIVPFILMGILISLIFSRQLTILSLSEEVAVGLGQKTTQIKAVLFVVIILLAGAAVALVGNMVFIRLMVPHIVRAIVGTDYRLILPMSAILGATFMLLADTIGRTINSPYETPVVAVVAMIGLPFFLLIVRKGGKAFS
ncbi:iron ABC transporter permease [[Brevibacterium] frigoritolerans]|uniref:Iron ABC transporter permease n=1 Tax=Peribacillus frigoritolerans TaxID=450367 RepID=A0A941FHY9_9BACI|nr:iron ABC transporter permease [Peribacillus frigoritolerans]